MFFPISKWYLGTDASDDWSNKYITLSDIYNNCNGADATSDFYQNIFALSSTSEQQYLTKQYCSNHLNTNVTGAILAKHTSQSTHGLTAMVQSIYNQQNSIKSKINQLNGEFDIASLGFIVWTKTYDFASSLIKGSEFLYYYSNVHDQHNHQIVNNWDMTDRYISCPDINIGDIPGVYMSGLSISAYCQIGNGTPTAKDKAIINQIQSFTGAYSYAYGGNVAYIYSYNVFTRGPVASVSSHPVSNYSGLSSTGGEVGIEYIRINLKTLSDSIITSILRSNTQVLSYWNEGSTDYITSTDCFQHRNSNSTVNIFTYITSVDFTYSLYDFLGIEVSLCDGELEVAQWNNLFDNYYAQFTRYNGSSCLYPNSITVNGQSITNYGFDINIPHYGGDATMSKFQVFLVYDGYSLDHP